MEELELREYWHIIRKRWLLVVLIPVIAVIISGVLSFFVIKPQYQATTTLLVNQKISNNTALQQDIAASQALVNTYTNIIKSENIESTVIANLHLHMTPAQVNSMVSVSSPNQSQVIQVDVTSPSYNEAMQIANGLASVFQQKAQVLMNVQNVQIIDKALQQANPHPVKPNKKLNLAIALILGLMVSIGLAFLLEYLDNRIRSEDDVRRYLNLPVLGTVMDFEAK